MEIQLQELHSLINEVTEGVQAELEDCLKAELNATKSSIFADRTQLVSLIRNLLENAIKYSSKPPRITIRTENVDDKLVFSVADKGFIFSFDAVFFVMINPFKVVNWKLNSLNYAEQYKLFIQYISINAFMDESSFKSNFSSIYRY